MFVNASMIPLVTTVNNVLMDSMVMHKMAPRRIVSHAHVRVARHAIRLMSLVLVAQLESTMAIPLFAPIVPREVPVLAVIHVKKTILAILWAKMDPLPIVNCVNVTVTSPRVPLATATPLLESA